MCFGNICHQSLEIHVEHLSTLDLGWATEQIKMFSRRRLSEVQNRPQVIILARSTAIAASARDSLSPPQAPQVGKSYSWQSSQKL